MGTIPLDYSFEREGVALVDWLWRLVDADPKTRQQAGNALQAMDYGVPYHPFQWHDLAEFPNIPWQRQRLAEEVRRVVSQLDFALVEFLHKLAAYRLALAADSRQRSAQESARTSKRDDQFERLAERLTQTITGAASEQDKEEAATRFARLCAVYICGAACPKDDPLQTAEILSPAGMMAHRLLEILSEELLTAPEALHALLCDSHERRYALVAFARLGPAALAFAPRLLAELDDLTQRDPHAGYGYDGAEALGAIARGNAELVEAMSRRLDSPLPEIRLAALQVVAAMDADVSGQEELLAGKIVPLLHAELEDYFAVRALASVGRHLPWVRNRLLELARPRPADWKEYPGFPGHTFDKVMCERGSALDAFRYLTDYPEECVPVLLDAIDTFVEYDPDEGYDGPLGRIASILKRFGPKASAAAGALVAHLRDADEGFPKAILQALAAMGPAAQQVLPELYAFRAELSDPESLADLATTPVDEFTDPVGWTIQQIQAQN